MTDHIVLDVEIARTVEEAGGWEHTEAMGVGCAVVYEHRSDRFRVYGPRDTGALQERIGQAELITGFNVISFDIPVVFGLSRGEAAELLPRFSCNDLLSRIWRALGRHSKGWSLSSVARGTLGVDKSGDGALASELFKAGEWGRLVDYCMEDVRLTRDLGLFVDRYGYLVSGDTAAVLSLRGIPS